jgi:hypothetical protein
MTTAYALPVTALAFLADSWGVEVFPANDIPRVECPRCDAVGAVTVARITGPREDGSSETAECCIGCVEREVREAHAAQKDHGYHPIRLELAS